MTSEHEEDTWTSLTATLLTGPEIVRAKMLGAAWGARRMGVALLAVWGVGLLSGAVHPLGFLVTLAGLGIYTWFATALGLSISLKARNSTRAMIGTILLMIALNVGYMPHCGRSSKEIPRSRSSATPHSSSSSPCSPTATYVPSGRADPSSRASPSPGMATLVVIMASFALYAAGALALTRAPSGSLDTAVGRPRLGTKGADRKGEASPSRRSADEASLQAVEAL